jgi:preprotein translocase subunit SecG
LFAAIGQTLFGVLLTLMAIFMILLILVQRGRGGGLAGALGGMGGSSAFGAKAGDVFTRITAWSALVWIALCIAASHFGSGQTSRLDVPGRSGSSTATREADDRTSAGAPSDAAEAPLAPSDGPAEEDSGE